MRTNHTISHNGAGRRGDGRPGYGLGRNEGARRKTATIRRMRFGRILRPNRWQAWAEQLAGRFVVRRGGGRPPGPEDYRHEREAAPGTWLLAPHFTLRLAIQPVRRGSPDRQLLSERAQRVWVERQAGHPTGRASPGETSLPRTEMPGEARVRDGRPPRGVPADKALKPVEEARPSPAAMRRVFRRLPGEGPEPQARFRRAAAQAEERLALSHRAAERAGRVEQPIRSSAAILHGRPVPPQLPAEAPGWREAHRQRAAPGDAAPGTPPAPAQAGLPPTHLQQITDQVIQQLDRRLLAHLERTGRRF
jgi:hypothetical protein